jgi:N-methylhydantoinase B
MSTKLEGLDDLADEIIHRTEKSMREAISQSPRRGLYEAEGIIEQGKGRTIS